MIEINGKDLMGMFICAAYNLKENYKKVDDLNVFPVPDGDTGSNMLKTFLSGIKELETLSDDAKIYEVAQTFSKGLLLGARGNSGVILSQIFAGLSNGSNQNETANKEVVLSALIHSKEQAYKSVGNPVEGTILTVVSDATKAALDALDSVTDVAQLVKIYLAEARESLNRTPLLLPVLKEAGVVDSGGAGYVYIVDGALQYFEGVRHTISEVLTNDVSSQAQSVNYLRYDFYELNKFGYCTEFTIRLNPNMEFNKVDFTKKLELFGYSIVIVNTDDIVKVHIHTKTPGDVFSFAQKYGALCAVKADNMAIQTKENSSLVVKKVIKENNNLEERTMYGAVAVVNGEGLKEMFTALGVNEIIDGGQTMNPSTKDFVDAVDKVNADHVFIFPCNKNVYMSAKAAKALINDKHVIVVPAKTIAEGYAALTSFDITKEDCKDVASDMELKIQSVKSGEVTYAIRNTISHGIQIEKDDYISIFNGSIVNSLKLRIDAVKDLISKMIDDSSMSITIFYGDDATEEELNILEEYLNEYENVFHQFINGGQKIYSYIIEVE